MISYRNLISSTHNTYEGREEIEWSNFWYDKSNTVEGRRVLLVGDSTSRMVRSTLAKKTNLPVDLFATSSGLHDELFCNQIESFFSIGRKYAAIYVQIGNHSRINDMGESYEDRDFERFKEDLTALHSYLKLYSDNIVYGTVFECVKPVGKIVFCIEKITGLKLEKWDESINQNTRKKNDIIEEVAKNNGGYFLDINGYMKKTHFLRIDHIHFEKSAVFVIADCMSQMLNKILR